MIVLNIVEGLIDETIAHDFDDIRRPVDVLRQYRRLLLTCKTFYDIIQNHRINVSIIVDIDDTSFNVLGGRDYDTFDYGDVEDGYSMRFGKFSSFFMLWQLEVITYHRQIFHVDKKMPSKYIYPQHEELGNFHLNPRFDLDYISRFRFSAIYPRVLLLLRQFLEQNSKKIDTFQKGERGINGFSVGNYIHEGTLSAIDYPKWFYSIGNWWHMDDPSINGFQVCDEVKEWWVWEEWNGRMRYFSGYVGEKAWVFDTICGIVYTTFGRPKEIVDRSLFEDIHDFNCVHCGSDLLMN